MARRQSPAKLVVGTIRRRRAHLLRGTALQAATALAFATHAGAQLAPNARPAGGQVTYGSATIGQTTSTTTINQSTQRAAIDWTSFNVGSQQTVQFNQPNSASLTLNRVTGPDPSAIAGHINANGGIILTNPSGVVFYQGAQVNAANLVVSAAGITNQNFAAGKMVFDQAPHPNAAVVNNGTLTLKDTGLAALVAPRVANAGVINARLGRVVLAGAETHTLDVYGDGLVAFDVTQAVRQVPLGPDGKPATALVTNTGTVIADGGVVQITAKAVDGVVQNLVNAGGRIQANSVGSQTGQIAIDGVGGSVRVIGEVAANGGKGPTGGQIAISASNTVGVESRARITANGGTGGGTVALGTTIARAQTGRVAALTGGPAPGLSGAVARRVTVTSRASVSADALVSGNGGTITVLGTEQTTISGQLSARGGETSGNGGVVEVSGGKVTLGGILDTTAHNGNKGTIYIDPTDVDICTDCDASVTDISPRSLHDMSLTGNVVVTADHDLLVLESVSLGENSAGVPSSLTLSAGNQLKINPNGSQLSIAALGDITLKTTGSASPPDTGSSVTIGDNTVVSTQGSVIVQAANRLDIGANVALSAGQLPAQSQIDLQAGYYIGVGQNTKLTVATSATASATSPTIRIASGGDINIYDTGVIIDAGSGPVTIASGSTIPGTTMGGIVPPVNTAGSVTLFGTDSISGGSINVTSTFQTNGTGSVSVGSGSTLTSGSGPISLQADNDLTLGGVITANQNQITGYTRTGGITVQNGAVISAQDSVLLEATRRSTDPGLGSAVTVNGSLTGSNILISAGAGGIALGGNLNATNPGTEVGVVLRGVLDEAGSSFDSPTVYGPITQTGGLITTPTLVARGTTVSLTSANDIDQLAANPVQRFNSLASAGDFTLINAKALNILGSVTASSGAVTIQAAGLSVAGDITGSRVSLTSTAAFSQSAGTIEATGPDGTGVLAVSIATHSGDLGQSSGALIRADVGSLMLNSSNSATLGGTVTSNSVLNLSSGAAVTELSGASLQAQVLTGSVGSATLNATGNQIGNLGTFTSTGNVTLADGESLQVTGAVSVTNGTLNLQDPTGTVTENGGSLNIGTLTGTVGSATLNAAGNQIGTLGAFTSTGNFTLVDSEPLQVTGAVSVTNGTFNLQDATGAVTENGGSLSVGTLTGTVGSATLNATGNQISNLGTFTSTGNVTLADGVPLQVTGAVSVTNGTLNLQDPTGAVAENGGSLSVGTLTGTVGSATLNATGNQISNLATFTSTGNVTLADSAPLEVTGAVSVTNGTLNLQDPTGAVAENGGSLHVGTLTGAVSSATLNATGNQIGTLGAFTSAGNFTLTDGSPLTVTGPVSAGTTLNVADKGSQLTLQGGSLQANSVQLSVSGPNAPQLLQAGTTTIQPASAATGTLQLAVQGGTITLSNLQAGQMDTTLTLDAGGIATGRLAANSLEVTGYGGSALLTGTVAGRTGFEAAGVATISPLVNTDYLLNGCAISTACGVQNTIPLDIAVAAITPKSFLDTTLGSVFKPFLFTVDLITIGVIRDPTDPELVLPDISDRDY